MTGKTKEIECAILIFFLASENLLLRKTLINSTKEELITIICTIRRNIRVQKNTKYIFFLIKFHQNHKPEKLKSDYIYHNWYCFEYSKNVTAIETTIYLAATCARFSKK